MVNQRQNEKSADPRFGSQFAASVLVTRKVAAAILGVSAKTLTRMCQAGQIRGVSRPSGEIRFSEAELRNYLASRSETPEDHRAPPRAGLDIVALKG